MSSSVVLIAFSKMLSSRLRGVRWLLLPLLAVVADVAVVVDVDDVSDLRVFTAENLTSQ